MLRERVDALLDLAGLAGVTTRIGGYSRGMKQRLGVAQALINAPRLLLLDEPTSALDPIGRRELLEMIAGLAGRTTVFFSTHILADVERVCDTVAILARGRVVEQAGIDDAEGAPRRRSPAGGRGRRHRAPAGRVARRAVARGRRPREGRELVLEVTDLETAFREVPAAVAAQGLALRRLEAAEVSLEEVFVDLVEGRGVVNGFAAFLAKELREARKTWRLWVLPGILRASSALTTPVLAAVTPALLRATAERSPGVVDPLPRRRSRATPTSSSSATWRRSRCWSIIVTGAATVAARAPRRHRRADAHQAALARRLRRRQGRLGGIAVVLVGHRRGQRRSASSSRCCSSTTGAHRRASPPRSACGSRWRRCSATLMVLLSAATQRQAPAAGAGVAVYVALFVLTGFPLVRDHSPAGLMAANDALLNGQDVALLGRSRPPSLLAALFVGGASLVFRRKEL